jgi:hypothetical protein
LGRGVLVRGLVALALLSGAATQALACPSCKAATGRDGEATLNAYFVSILFMLAMPFALAGGLAFLLWRSSRRRPPEAAAAAAAPEGAGAERDRELAGVP